MEIAQLLVDSGADVNAQGGFHGSALQAAVARGHTGIAQLLQLFGALES
jgi:ankyrin repeat protein